MYKEITLDVTGLPCPMPIVKLKKFLSERSGEAIKLSLVVSDRGALKDIPAFCRQQNVACDLILEKNGMFEFELLIGVEYV